MKFPGILFSVGFLHCVELVWRRLGRRTNTCTYPITLPYRHSQAQSLSHSSHSWTITPWRINSHLENPTFLESTHGLQDTCPPPPQNTPQMKSQILPTSNGEGNVQTKEAARMNHRKEAEVGIKVLFFFFFFYYKKKNYSEEVQMQHNITGTI